MINKNNPAYKLAEKNVPLIAKDVVENGEIGTAGQRLLETTAKAIMKETWLFNTMGRQLRGKGARLNKLKYTTRQGWRERAKDRKEWMEFGNHQGVKFLSENLVVNKTLETSFGWSKYDLKDIEGGIENIKTALMNSLTEELPVEFEKRVINGLKDATLNGVSLQNDNGGSLNGVQAPTAYPKRVVINTDYSDDENVKTIINQMIGLSIRMGQQETPLTYRIGATGKYEWLINPFLDAAIQRVGAYQSFSGDSAYDRLLNNRPTKALNNIPVQISYELGEEQPFILKPRSGAFPNIEFIFTTLPTSFFTRVDYEGTSATDMFYKSESDEFAINFSYWATKIGLWGAGVVDETTGIKQINVHFKSNDYLSGDTEIEYTLQVPAGRTFAIYLISDTYEETLLTQTPVIDGTPTTLTKTEVPKLGGLKPASYMLQVRELIDGTDWAISTSATYYVRNKAYDPIKLGEVSNQKAELTQAQSDEAFEKAVEARIKAEKAKWEKEAKDIVDKAKDEAEKELEEDKK